MVGLPRKRERCTFDLMPTDFRIRRATVQDAEIIAWHRARMFQDMGQVSDEAFEPLRAKARARIAEWLSDGQYVGWLASQANNPKIVIAGAGIHLLSTLPRPLGLSKLGEGRQGVIINVFTEPEWRRHGIATMLVKQIIKWSKSEHVDWLTLHASDEGRAVYERLGFVANNEMRFAG
jgi:GNAT superfamily N-acetyltransferase